MDKHNGLFFSVKMTRMAMGAGYAVLAIIMILWVIYLRFDRRNQLTPYLPHFCGVAFVCLFCCFINCLDLPKHIKEVGRTAGINVDELDTSDATQEFYERLEEEYETLPSSNSVPPAPRHDVMSSIPSTSSQVDWDGVEHLENIPLLEVVSQGGGSNRTQVVKVTINENKIEEESVL